MRDRAGWWANIGFAVCGESVSTCFTIYPSVVSSCGWLTPFWGEGTAYLYTHTHTPAPSWNQLLLSARSPKFYKVNWGLQAGAQLCLLAHLTSVDCYIAPYIYHRNPTVIAPSSHRLDHTCWRCWEGASKNLATWLCNLRISQVSSKNTCFTKLVAKHMRPAGWHMMTWTPSVHRDVERVTFQSSHPSPQNRKQNFPTLENRTVKILLFSG